MLMFSPKPASGSVYARPQGMVSLRGFGRPVSGRSYGFGDTADDAEFAALQDDSGGDGSSDLGFDQTQDNIDTAIDDGGDTSADTSVDQPADDGGDTSNDSGASISHGNGGTNINWGSIGQGVAALANSGVQLGAAIAGSKKPTAAQQKAAQQAAARQAQGGVSANPLGAAGAAVSQALASVSAAVTANPTLYLGGAALLAGALWFLTRPAPRAAAPAA